MNERKWCEHMAEGWIDNCKDCRIAELVAQLHDAHELIDTLAGCIDGYYIELNHCRISEHEAYMEKWGIEED